MNGQEKKAVMRKSADMEKITDYKLLLDTAVLAGQIMLQNGAEIYRVEDTIHRILKMSRFKYAEAYVTPTGLIVTLDDPKTESMTVMKRIDTRGTNLYRITIANQISREFCAGEISLKEAFHALKHMESGPYPMMYKDMAGIVASMAFSVLLGGSLTDALGAGLAGVCMVFAGRICRRIKINDFLTLLLSSAVIAVTACALGAAAWTGMERDRIIIGAIMPMLPGAAATTAVRDTLQGDYVAGGAKALEAFIHAAAIALGVWLGMFLSGGVF